MFDLNLIDPASFCCGAFFMCFTLFISGFFDFVRFLIDFIWRLKKEKNNMEEK